jgi:hypothetical protein
VTPRVSASSPPRRGVSVAITPTTSTKEIPPDDSNHDPAVAGRAAGGRLGGVGATLRDALRGAGEHASAAIPDLTRVSASSVTDSFLGKSAIASCPARTGLIGTAARISGGDGQVVLEGVRPNVQQRTVTVTAHEDHDGTTANWSVTATAICANIPASNS